jgi:hypothetical protein
MNDERVFEKHYRIAELAKLWGLGRECVRQLVKIEPDVIRREERQEARTHDLERA